MAEFKRSLEEKDFIILKTAINLKDFDTVKSMIDICSEEQSWNGFHDHQSKKESDTQIRSKSERH